MGEYFGYDIAEREDGDFTGLLDGVDPAYHEAIAVGIYFLCEWYGDKAEREVDDWFTAVYATVLKMEELMNDRIASYRDQLPKVPRDYSIFEAKDD